MRAIIIVSCLLFMSSPASSSMSQSIEKFSKKIFVQFPSANTNNIMSPFSMHDDLTMAGSGARGKTYCEIYRALDLTGNRNSVAVQYKQLLDPLYEPASALKVANGIYIMDGLTISSDYNALLTTNYHTTVKSLDFEESQESADVINNDVSTATNGKIQNIIPATALTADTKMVLVNSVYFLSKWQHKFPKQQTADRAFYTAVGASGQIRTMQQTNYMMVGDVPSLDATLISLSYVDQCFSFNVLLPKTITGLASLEKKLSSQNLALAAQKLKQQYVQLQLPSFEITTSLDLVSGLQNIGIKTAFTPNADFGLMIDGVSDIQISSVVHKAYIKVDEDGTEAAAATGIVVGTTAVIQRPEPIVINVDHPFLFYISNCNNTIFFMGHFYGKTA